MQKAEVSAGNMPQKMHGSSALPLFTALMSLWEPLTPIYSSQSTKKPAKKHSVLKPTAMSSAPPPLPEAQPILAISLAKCMLSILAQQAGDGTHAQRKAA